ncbi:helix-turn-helix domain-containing protein [Exiguobacterium undae]
MNSLNISISNEIKRIRQERNWTQSELCRGICSQAEISKIENGRNSPTVELLQQIAERLHIPVSAFFINEKQKINFQTIDQELIQLMRLNQYPEMLQRIDQHLMQATDKDLIILLRYHKLIVKETTKIIDYRTCITQLLNMTADENMIEESFLMYLRIQMSIAILYTNNGEYRHADAIYLSLLKDEYPTVEYKKIKFKILYNYIRNLIKQKDFTAILKETEIAINESNYLKDLSYLGHFYYQRGYALEQLDSSLNLIQESYTLAYGIFLATENTSYANILEEHLADLMYFSLKHIDDI